MFGKREIEKPEEEKPITTKLLKEVVAMVEYALEVGQLPDSVEANNVRKLELMATVDSSDILLSDAVLDVLAKYHRDLSEALAPITARTLQETRKVRFIRSRIGRYLCFLYALTGLLVFVILSLKLLESGVWKDGQRPIFLDPVAYFFPPSAREYLVPFLYGALGSCAYLLRISGRKLRMRSFDSRRIIEHFNRLVLGTLSGGVIVLFSEELLSGSAASADLVQSGSGEASALAQGDIETRYGLTQGALGFIAGYSVELLFNILDRIIDAILPQGRVDRDGS